MKTKKTHPDVSVTQISYSENKMSIDLGEGVWGEVGGGGGARNEGLLKPTYIIQLLRWNVQKRRLWGFRQ